MDKNDKEYLALLKKHLTKAYEELNELKKSVNMKIIEIDQLEELITIMEGKHGNADSNTSCN